MKKRIVFSFGLAVGLAFAQYKVEPAGAPPSDLAPAIASALSPQGLKILGGNGSVYCEIWFRSAIPKGAKSAEANVAFPTIPHGSLMGAIRFPAQAADRRGQSLKPGTYTLRYSLQPVDGDHQGVAPQRDFLALVPAGEDKDPNATPAFDELMKMSRKASGTPHPAVLAMEPASGEAFPAFNKEGEHDWALAVKVGDQPFAVILIGKTEA
jgi:hypothetical protein